MTPRRRLFAALTAFGALVLTGACGGGTAPVDVAAEPARDTPPATREPAGQTREPAGSSRESPGAGREPPSGGQGAPGGAGTGQCLTCPKTYQCTIESGGSSSRASIDLVLKGGACVIESDNGDAVFNCDGTVTVTGAPTQGGGWLRTSDGGFMVVTTTNQVTCVP
jgi:hypothetical protein